MYLSEKFSPLKTIILGAVFGASFALLFPLYMNWVVELGHRIPQENMLNDYCVAIVWAGLLGTSIMFWPIPYEDKPHVMFIT